MSQSPLHQEGGSHGDLESGGGVHVLGPSRSQWNPAHLNLAPSWLDAISGLFPVWTISNVLLILSDPINSGDGNEVLNTLFLQHPISFYFIVIIGTATCFKTYAWWMWTAYRIQPSRDRNFAIVLLFLGVLSVTLTLNALLSNKFNCILWIFVIVNVGIMLGFWRRGFHRHLESGGGVHDPGFSTSQRNPAHSNLEPPSRRMISWRISLAVLIWYGLVSLKNPINGGDGNNVLNTLFLQHPRSFYFIRIIYTAAIFIVYAWLMLTVDRIQDPKEKYNAVGTISAGGVIGTVYLNALFSNESNYIIGISLIVYVWIIWVMQGHEHLIGWTDKIRALVMQGCECAARWMYKIRRVVRGGQSQ